MASSGAELRYKKAKVFLLGHGLLILGFIFFTVGFATDNWLYDEYDRHFGLWTSTTCYGGVCTSNSSNFPPWMIATRAMQTMAMICYMAGALLALFFHCASMTMPRCASLASKARVLELSVTIGSGFCLIGVIVYGTKGNQTGFLEYSYNLTVSSLFFNTAGVIVVAVTRNHINYNTNVSNTTNNNNSIAPHEPLPSATTTVTSGQYPGPGRQQYPYGHGAEFGGGLNAGGGTRDIYPYGTGGDGGPGSPHYANPPPASQQDNLPYPLRPGRSLPMPEPEPVRGREGLGGGGNGPGPTGRLPPINPNATPSAPPPHIDDEEQPPSYMEAVGGYSQR